MTAAKIRLGWLFVLCTVGTSIQAQTLQSTFRASRDTVLFEESGNSNGSGPSLFSGRIASGERRRSLLAFDGLSGLPSGSQITSVTLTLNMTRTRGGTVNVSLHRLSAAWGEAGSDSGDLGGFGAPAQAGDASWNQRVVPSQNWATPGGDFSPVASATIAVDPTTGPYQWSGAGLIADVQNWVDNPSSNNGWLVMSDETAGNQTAMRFSSRENPLGLERPSITVLYRPAGVPSGPVGIPGLSNTSKGLLALIIGVIGLMTLIRRRA